MGSHFLDISYRDPPIRWNPTQLGECTRRSLRIVRLAPHPQILGTVDRNRDGEDPIGELTPKESSDILYSLVPIIIHQQVTYLKMVIYLHANIGGHWDRGLLEIQAS